MTALDVMLAGCLPFYGAYVADATIAAYRRRRRRSR